MRLMLYRPCTSSSAAAYSSAVPGIVPYNNDKIASAYMQWSQFLSYEKGLNFVFSSLLTLKNSTLQVHDTNYAEPIAQQL